ncbi:putative ribonuclease H protein [Vitis vinifera]|uniref:Putative ribonuclease H protein n=1 Tax=Vitis vinifera TaxID=29760 RepID=A0A438F3S7_VITVI|nr:putative ribonuclease H protein [Vitis vinifera]
MWFEAASGLRINLEKSELIPVGRVESMDDLAEEFGCSLGSLPTTYLGMPLGAPFKSVTVWDGVEERFRRRLTMWKRQYLSKGGRATLIRSTLSNLPIYLMSLLCLPSSVRRRLEKIQRDFLWGGGNLEHKPHLVRWELVCLSKAKGGLGVKSLSLLNKTLLAKWNWRFANEREALWNQVIRGKYGEARGGWCWREVREAHGLGLWKGIRADWKLVSDRMTFIVEGSVVADIWDPLAEGGWGGWNPCFLRAFNDWEVEEAERFMERIQSKRVIEDVEDTVSWTETKSGKFSVKSLYIALEAGGSSLFPSSFIWNANVQPKISFFAWEATWGKALTLDLVQKRGWALANRCFMCLEKEETINHLLLHCSRTRALWDLLFALFGVSWVLPFSVRDTLLCWNGFFMGKNRKKVIGPYRSGKSFLLNQLLSLSCYEGAAFTTIKTLFPFGFLFFFLHGMGFGVGHMRDTKTKGIWVWGTPIEMDIDGVKSSVLYLDTEGFESIGKSNVYDDRIFALATILSSVLIYNLPETIPKNQEF